MISELGFFSAQAREDEARLRADYSDLFDLAAAVTREFLRLAGDADLTPQLEKNLRVNALALRSIELFQSAFSLLGQGAIPAAKVVCRSLIETVFKLSALQLSGEGMEMYLAQDHASRLQKLKAFRKYKLMRNQPASANADAEIDALGKKKVESPAVAKWAKEAGMDDFYNVYYAVLSDDIHSSVEALDHYLDADSDSLMSFGPTAKGLALVGAICNSTIIVALERYALFLGVSLDLKEFSVANKKLEEKYSTLDEAN